jgi:ferrous iron transport protein A
MRPPSSSQPDPTTLDRLQPGQSGRVLRVDAEPTATRRLMELGIVPGTLVEVVRRAPLGDPIELRLRQIHLSVRHTEAAHIHVELA